MTLPIQFGPYVLLERLGQGAQGDVHLARHVRGSNPVVIKRMAPHRTSDEDFVRRFRHEAVIATSVKSPNVIEVLDVGRVDDRLYLVMEYVAGWPLSRVIRDLHQNRQRASVPSVVDVVAGALDGLHALHTARAPDGTSLGIVHRDIAPKNLMLADDGTVKVIDLGLGKSKRQDWVTNTGVVMGTPGYMAPEQAVAETVDHRTDIFAMGVVLFELLTLERYLPLRPLAEMLSATLRSHYRPPSSSRSDLPPVFDEIVKRALEIDPSRRFQSAKEFADAVRGAMPRREEKTAKTLLSALAWNEVTKSSTAVRQMVSRDLAYDETKISARTVFSERDDSSGYAPTVRRSPARASRSWKGAATATGAAALVALGWLGRGFVETPAPATALPVPALEQPMEEPRPIATALPVETIEAPPPPVERRAPRRTIAKASPPPPRVEAPPPPREEAAKPSEEELRTSVARMTRRASQLARDPRAKELLVRLNRMTALPTLVGLERELKQLETELARLTSQSRAD